MFSLGLGEILVIFIIALIVIKEDNLPALFKSFAKAYKSFKEFNNEISSKINTEISEITTEFKDFEEEIDSQINEKKEP